MSTCIKPAVFGGTQPSTATTVPGDVVTTFFFENGSRKCTVTGFSMEPFLSYGQEVVINRCVWPLKKGHCYAFLAGKNLTIHRFVKTAGDKIALFAGDSSIFPDRVPFSNIIGELSACNSRGVLCILKTINDVFINLMAFFDGFFILNRIRRRLIRYIVRFNEKRGCGNEEKI